MTMEDQPDFVPPSPERVAARALVMSAIVCRSAIENEAGNHEAEEFHQEVIAWLKTLGLDSEAEAAEMKLLQTPLGQLTTQEAIDASWKTEATAVLAWALRRYELPDYDIQGVAPDIADALGFMEQKGDTSLYLPQLRSRIEIDALADQMFTLHWRLRQYSLDAAPMDFQEFARTAWFGPLSLNGVRLLEKDLAIQGTPLSRATEEQWREVLSSVQERHQAVNWLLGYEETYSEITTDT